MARSFGIVVSSEHAGNRIPAAHASLFADKQALLASHSGYDRGALGAARELAARLGARLVYGTTSRLLVDLNRSLHHPKLFSAPVNGLSRGERDNIVRRHYLPYRERLRRLLDEELARRGFVVHLSVHSFTPVLDGVVRNADLGLLYDPGRRRERRFARSLRSLLAGGEPALRTRLNYPYLGIADGAVTAMRRELSARQYLGIELELNQRVFAARGAKRAREVLARAFVRVLSEPAISAAWR
jgi:predicted N-formylglutamate amidohydrolase